MKSPMLEKMLDFDSGKPFQLIYAIPFYDSCTQWWNNMKPYCCFWICIKSKLINWRCVNGCVYQMWLTYILHIYVTMFDGLILIFTGQIQFLTINTFFADWSSMFVGSILCLTVKIWFWCSNGLVVQELYSTPAWDGRSSSNFKLLG